MSQPPKSDAQAGDFAVVEGWSGVDATGPDAVGFLQGFCTNDVARLADGESCEAMFTDVKAHVVAHGWVCRVTPERCVVAVASDRGEGLLRHLDRYLIRERVELRPALGSFAVVGESLGLRAHQERGVPGGRLQGDLEFLLATNDEANEITASLEQEGRRRLTEEEFELRRIALGVPIDGVDVDERNLPQELDRNEHAISFTKGCYLGQEPVARIDALGRVNWLLRGLVIESGERPKEGAAVNDGEKQVGRITSSVESDGRVVALAYLRREHAEPGTRLSVAGATATVRAFPIAD